METICKINQVGLDVEKIENLSFVLLYLLKRGVEKIMRGGKKKKKLRGRKSHGQLPRDSLKQELASLCLCKKGYYKEHQPQLCFLSMVIRRKCSTHCMI